MAADPRDVDLVEAAMGAMPLTREEVVLLVTEARRQAALDMRERCAAVAERQGTWKGNVIARAIRALEPPRD